MPHLEQEQPSQQQWKGCGQPGLYKNSTPGQTQSRPSTPPPPPASVERSYRVGSFSSFLQTPGCAAVGLRACSPNRLPHLQLMYGEATGPDMGATLLPADFVEPFPGPREASNGDQETFTLRGFTLVETAL